MVNRSAIKRVNRSSFWSTNLMANKTDRRSNGDEGGSKISLADQVEEQVRGPWVRVVGQHMDPGVPKRIVLKPLKGFSTIFTDFSPFFYFVLFFSFSRETSSSFSLGFR